MPRVDEPVATTAVGATLPGSNPRGVEPSLLPRGATLGRYLVLDRLAVGGMGLVYSAYDPELNRKVALKLLRSRPGQEGNIADDQARLLREAQAMARLSHPNVVTVYDVGAFQEGIFIAMELVEGETLNAWVAERRRSWQEMLDAFVQAGRGLAAAHAAGIVHRDFKPHNVLVGRDGRVRVTDFGLARAAGEVPIAPETPQPRSISSDSLSTPLTVAGAVMGTPGYMSLEQIRGQAVDARSDQFSYCVTLYEALYQDRPFRGSTLSDLETQIDHAQVRPPPRGSPVPGWLRKILLRGLSRDPARRVDSMDALLDAIARRRAASRSWRWAGAGMALLAVVASGYHFAAVRGEARCAGAAGRLAGIWDLPAKQAIRRAFESSGRVYARDAWAGTERTLDAWSRDWVASSAANCRAEEHAPDPDFLRRQRSCLDDRLGELKALASLLGTADPKLVDTAVEAAYSLAPPRVCSDVRRLHAASDGTAAEPAAPLREALGEAIALRLAGRYASAVKAGLSVAESARKSGLHGLRAESLMEIGYAENSLGDAKPAIEALEEADVEADASGLDWLRAQIAAHAAHACYLVDDLKPGRRWAQRAEAIITRIGGDPGLEAEVDAVEAALSAEEGKLEDAIRQQGAGVSLLRSVYGAEHPNTIRALRNLANALEASGRFEESLSAAEEAEAASARLLGSEHPATLAATSSVATVLFDLGEYDRSLELSRRCLEIAEREYGAENYRVGEAADGVGNALLADGDAGGALDQFRRVEGIYRKVWGPENYYVGLVLSSEADALRDLGRTAEARSIAQRALEIITKGIPRQDAAAVALQELGELALDQRKFAEARTYFKRAVAGQEAALGANSVLLASSLTGAGEAALGARDAASAVQALERAMKLREGRRVPREADARTRFALARALWEKGAGRDPALQLAREAREGYAAGAKRDRKKVSTVDAWIAGHPN